MAARAQIDPALLTALRAAVRAHVAEELEAERVGAEALRARVVPVVREALAGARRGGLCGKVWLFGSYAWGMPSDRSDVDLLADSCPDPDALASAVGRATGTDVHVVRADSAPRTLTDRVEAEGVAL